MMTVRFPNGQAIQYNDACTIYHTAGEWELYTTTKEKGGRLIAMVQASAGVVVEWTRPCAITNPLASQAPAAAFETVKQHLRTMPAGQVRELKILLRPFNARRLIWK